MKAKNLMKSLRYINVNTSRMKNTKQRVKGTRKMKKFTLLFSFSCFLEVAQLLTIYLHILLISNVWDQIAPPLSFSYIDQ